VKVHALPASAAADTASIMRFADLPVDRKALDALCERWGVLRLELFGSFARGDARPDSDVDFLVTLRAGAAPGLQFVQFVLDLEAVLGREVDVLERSVVEDSDNPYFRAEALRVVEPVYVAAAA
jgi:uncharacterized protein